RQERYDALPAAARTAIDRASGEALARKVGEAFDRQEKEVRARVAASGRNQVVSPSPAELDQWKQAIAPVNAAWRAAKPRNERIHAAFAEQLRRVRAAS